MKGAILTDKGQLGISRYDSCCNEPHSDTWTCSGEINAIKETYKSTQRAYHEARPGLKVREVFFAKDI
jgi:hypothetical protein